jgi:hypothetical protein
LCCCRRQLPVRCQPAEMLLVLLVLLVLLLPLLLQPRV